MASIKKYANFSGSRNTKEVAIIFIIPAICVSLQFKSQSTKLEIDVRIYLL